MSGLDAIGSKGNYAASDVFFLRPPRRLDQNGDDLGSLDAFRTCLSVAAVVALLAVVAFQIINTEVDRGLSDQLLAKP